MSRRPHALVFSREYPPVVVGGTSTAARNLAVGLVEQHWDVSVVTTAPGAAVDTLEDLDGVSVQRVGTGSVYQARSGLADDALRVHRRLLSAAEALADARAVDAVLLPDLFCYPEAALLAQRRAVPLVNILLQDFRGITPYDRDAHHVTTGVSAHHDHLVALEEKSYRGSDHTAFISQALSDAITGYYGADAPHSTVYLGVDPTEIAAVQAEDGWAVARRELLARTSQDRLLVAVGRLVPVKGFDHLLEAVRLLEPQGPGGAHLVLVGTGPEETHLRAKAAALGLQDRVTFLTGIPRREAMGWMSVADVAVVPSLWESFCYVCAEMMALGRPVVATAVDSLRELLPDESVGYPVPVAGPLGARRLRAGDLAARIEEALADPAEAARRGAAARARMLGTFTNERFARGIAAIAAELVGTRS
ncbi:glycosyltransferase family 4 protein [Saccharothrix deserti]|uniref:glycosyltransferase family 4 protein n=1 Tax=Saccharothrix deserti TaxID=2593674 RepID=UPI00131EB2ED|nr:glycosyltransferase family 4 protein [Saccharothrix deserti]